MSELSARKVLQWIVVLVILMIIVVSIVRVRSCQKAREERLDMIFGE